MLFSIYVFLCVIQVKIKWMKKNFLSFTNFFLYFTQQKQCWLDGFFLISQLFFFISQFNFDFNALYMQCSKSLLWYILHCLCTAFTQIQQKIQYMCTCVYIASSTGSANAVYMLPTVCKHRQFINWWRQYPSVYQLANLLSLIL